MASKVEIDLMKFREHNTKESWPNRVPERHPDPGGWGKRYVPLARGGKPCQTPGPCCHCGKDGHRAAKCLASQPETAALPTSQPPKKRTLVKSKEKTCVVQQTVEFPSQFREEERTPTKPRKDSVFYENDSKEEDDPIESGTIIPMMPR